MDDKVTYRKGYDTHGREWHTAKYSSVQQGYAVEQHVIFAEGNGGVINNQGVWWYQSKEKALHALQKTVYVTFWALPCSLPQGIVGPFQLAWPAERKRPNEGLVDDYGKRARVVRIISG